MILVGALLLASVVTGAVGVVVMLILLTRPPLPLPILCAFIALILLSAAVALYCYGWFSVTLGGPFPELCTSKNAAGANLVSLKEGYWPLRSACLYSDGSSVDYVSMSINVIVCLLSGFALVAGSISVFLRKQAGQPSGVTS